MQEREREDFFSKQEYFVCPKFDEYGRPVLDPNTGKQILVSEKREVDFGEFPEAVNLDSYPECDSPGRIQERQSDMYILLRTERDENPYDQARRIKMEQQNLARMPSHKVPKRGYLD